MNKIKLGCDPEAFLIDIHGQLKSSIGLIGGSKDMPRPLFALGEGYAVQEDNVAIEFNIPPAEGRSSFIASISATLKHLTDMAQTDHGLSICQLSAASFPMSELQAPAALEFGCDPDYNAWTMEMNPRPSADDKTLRSCGGHVHIGYDMESEVSATNIVRMMDLHLGVPSVLMDKGELRKQLYGKAGAYRIKPYGVEYRTLSNFWIFDDARIGWVWDNTNRAFEAAQKFEIDEQSGKDIVAAINGNDKDLAKSLIHKFNLECLHV